MNGLKRGSAGLAALVLATFVSGACQQKWPEDPFPVDPDRVRAVIKDLKPWVDVADLPRAERAPFRYFCRFVAIREICDDRITNESMSADEAVSVTQPLLDHLAQRGAAAESVLIKLLKARKGLEAGTRAQTLTKEAPEIYAAIVLWKMESQSAVPLFMEMAMDKRIDNRAVFIRGLGRIGAPQALGMLRELQRSEKDLEILVEAQEAVKVIERKQPKTEPPPPRKEVQGRDTPTSRPEASKGQPPPDKQQRSQDEPTTSAAQPAPRPPTPNQ